MPRRMSEPSDTSLLSGSLGGIVLMIGASVVLIFQHSTAKYLSADLSVLEIVFFRTITALLFFLPWIFRSGLAIFHTQRIGAAYVPRGAADAVGFRVFHRAGGHPAGDGDRAAIHDADLRGADWYRRAGRAGERAALVGDYRRVHWHGDHHPPGCGQFRMGAPCWCWDRR